MTGDSIATCVGLYADEGREGWTVITLAPPNDSSVGCDEYGNEIDGLGRSTKVFCQSIGFYQTREITGCSNESHESRFFDSNFDLDSIMKQRDEKPTDEKMGPAGSASERNKEIAKE